LQGRDILCLLFLGLLLKSLSDKNSLKQKYKEFYLSTKFIQLHLEKYQPAIIFIDDNVAHYYLFAINHAKNVVLLNTRFFAQKSENLPPLDSDFIPYNSLFSKLYCEYLWFLHLSKRKLVLSKEKGRYYELVKNQLELGN
jgi:hypothetical protein